MSVSAAASGGAGDVGAARGASVAAPPVGVTAVSASLSAAAGADVSTNGVAPPRLTHSSSPRLALDIGASGAAAVAIEPPLRRSPRNSVQAKAKGRKRGPKAVGPARKSRKLMKKRVRELYGGMLHFKGHNGALVGIRFRLSTLFTGDQKDLKRCKGVVLWIFQQAGAQGTSRIRNAETPKASMVNVVHHCIGFPKLLQKFTDAEEAKSVRKLAPVDQALARSFFKRCQHIVLTLQTQRQERLRKGREMRSRRLAEKRESGAKARRGRRKKTVQVAEAVVLPPTADAAAGTTGSYPSLPPSALQPPSPPPPQFHTIAYASASGTDLEIHLALPQSPIQTATLSVGETDTMQFLHNGFM